MEKARKKIFLGWSGHQRYPAKAIELFRKRGYDTIYWISNDEDGTRIPGAIFHDKVTADIGLPAEGIDPSAFPPLEAETIRAFYKVESLTLTRMNKFSTSVDEKKRLYHEMLRYWKGVLEVYRPDYIIFSCYPHPLSFFILYSVGHAMGIPTIFLHETFVGRRLLFNFDYEKGPPLLAERLRNNGNIRCSEDDLPDDLKAFYNKHRTREDTSPVYMKTLSTIFSPGKMIGYDMRIVLRSLTDGSFFKRAYNLIGRTFKYSVENELKRLTVDPDFSMPYVYVPLHLQPEAQTSLEDIFADQMLMLEILSNALPEGWLLYVKENPFQFLNTRANRGGWSPTRYSGFYKKIAALGNTRFVPLSTDTFTLTKHSRAVATVVGTASLEAMLRDKPGLIFGYPWFADIPGLMRISGPKSAYEAFARIQEGFAPNQQRILAFLKSLGEASIRGTLDRLTPDEEGVSHEETIPRIVDLLATEMDAMFAR